LNNWKNLTNDLSNQQQHTNKQQARDHTAAGRWNNLNKRLANNNLNGMLAAKVKQQ